MSEIRALDVIAAEYRAAMEEQTRLSEEFEAAETRMVAAREEASRKVRQLYGELMATALGKTLTQMVEESNGAWSYR